MLTRRSLLSYPFQPLDGKALVLEGPVLTLPDGVSVEKEKGPDFYLYTFFAVPKAGDAATAKRQILSAYVGFAPDFPREAPRGTKPTISRGSGGIRITSLTWITSPKGHCRETLVETGRQDFARVLHLMYRGLNVADARIADSMIASVRSASDAPAVKRYGFLCVCRFEKLATEKQGGLRFARATFRITEGTGVGCRIALELPPLYRTAREQALLDALLRADREKTPLVLRLPLAVRPTILPGSDPDGEISFSYLDADLERWEIRHRPATR